MVEDPVEVLDKVQVVERDEAPDVMVAVELVVGPDVVDKVDQEPEVGEDPVELAEKEEEFLLTNVKNDRELGMNVQEEMMVEQVVKELENQ